jgi:competence protein ComEA
VEAAMKRLLLATALVPLSVGLAFATVNVNTAQQSELLRVKGLDKHKAKAIIEYRAENGPFASVEDLEKLPGFTPEVVAKVAPEVAFSGDPYVPPKKPAPKAKRK